MITLNVHIADKKSEKAIRAVLDALNVSYDVASPSQQKLSKKDQAIYDRLKDSFEQIKLHQAGQIELRDASELINEL